MLQSNYSLPIHQSNPPMKSSFSADQQFPIEQLWQCLKSLFLHNALCDIGKRSSNRRIKQASKWSVKLSRKIFTFPSYLSSPSSLRMVVAWQSIQVESSIHLWLVFIKQYNFMSRGFMLRSDMHSTLCLRCYQKCFWSFKFQETFIHSAFPVHSMTLISTIMKVKTLLPPRTTYLKQFPYL